MELRHLSTIRTETGLHEVDVQIDGKRYRFTLRTEQDVAMFNFHYAAGKKLIGKALAYLREHQIKLEEAS
jgi:hypothetical protein